MRTKKWDGERHWAIFYCEPIDISVKANAGLMLLFHLIAPKMGCSYFKNLLPQGAQSSFLVEFQGEWRYLSQVSADRDFCIAQRFVLRSL
ncbi:MAG: hypothetical protein LASZOEIN_002036 [Candidatus Fervidibacter sp.]|jgi:hypothetical protein